MGTLELEGTGISIVLLEINEEKGSSAGVAKKISGDRVIKTEAHETIEAESRDEEVSEVADEGQISAQVPESPKGPTMSVHEAGEA